MAPRWGHIGLDSRKASPGEFPRVNLALSCRLNADKICQKGPSFAAGEFALCGFKWDTAVEGQVTAGSYWGNSEVHVRNSLKPRLHFTQDMWQLQLVTQGLPKPLDNRFTYLIFEGERWFLSVALYSSCSCKPSTDEINTLVVNTTSRSLPHTRLVGPAPLLSIVHGLKQHSKMRWQASSCRGRCECLQQWIKLQLISSRNTDLSAPSSNLFQVPSKHTNLNHFVQIRVFFFCFSFLYLLGITKDISLQPAGTQLPMAASTLSWLGSPCCTPNARYRNGRAAHL